MWFEKIKRYYDAGIWNRKMVQNAVIKGKISLEEYQLITGESYPEEIGAPSASTMI